MMDNNGEELDNIPKVFSTGVMSGKKNVQIDTVCRRSTEYIKSDGCIHLLYLYNERKMSTATLLLTLRVYIRRLLDPLWA